MKILKYIFRKFHSHFSRMPEGALNWKVDDFKLAKKWALGQPDPEGEKSSLWARLYSPRKQSEEIIQEINILLEWT